MGLGRPARGTLVSTVPTSGGLLPLHNGVGGDVDGEGGDLSGRAPSEFPPFDLQPPGLCFLFLSCGGSPLEKRRGTSYIGVFRSRDNGTELNLVPITSDRSWLSLS